MAELAIHDVDNKHHRGLCLMVPDGIAGVWKSTAGWGGVTGYVSGKYSNVNMIQLGEFSSDQ